MDCNHQSSLTSKLKISSSRSPSLSPRAIDKISLNETSVQRGSANSKALNFKEDCWRTSQFGFLCYTGQHNKNLIEGYGILYDDEFCIEALWTDKGTKAVGLEYLNGVKIYDGQFTKGRADGWGTFFYMDGGTKREGQWEFGEKVGWSIQTGTNGSIVEGYNNAKSFEESQFPSDIKDQKQKFEIEREKFLALKKQFEDKLPILATFK